VKEGRCGSGDELIPSELGPTKSGRDFQFKRSLIARHSPSHSLHVSKDVQFIADPLAPTAAHFSRWMLLSATRRITSPSIRRSLPAMLATSTRPAVAGPNGKATYHTVTALKRWSCDDKELPAVSDVKAIHIYDFDNTCMYIATLCYN
jgi:hypothetical protein